MVLNKDLVRTYVEIYSTFDDTIFDNMYELGLRDYNYYKEKYGIIEDDNELMALTIVQKSKHILTIRNAKITNIKAQLIVDDIDNHIKRILSKYSSPIIYSDLEWEQ